MKNLEQKKRQRLILSAIVFLVGQLSPLITIPLVSGYSLAPEMFAIISGILFTAIPPLFTLTSVALVGKDGFMQLRSLALGWIRSVIFSRRISKARYQVGLVLFVIPFLMAWVSPYLRAVTNKPAGSLGPAIIGDAILITSLFVLGEDFWEKLRQLFVYNEYKI